MNQPYRTTRRVEFHHTDSAGILHFSNFFRFMEETEHEYLRACRLSVLLHDEQGPISFPRVHADCDYLAAARFEDLLTIELCAVRLGDKSLKFDFRVLREEQLLATGNITSVCCRLDARVPPRSIPLPDWIRQRLEAGGASSATPPSASHGS